MKAIDAPYNFVPLSHQVVTPEWAAQVSHDVPLKDGLSGEIQYTLTAHSPLLVGGEQRKATDRAPGEVRPFKTRNGYAIPGSSIKGMIRAVLEIVTFSRMRMVDDKRYGLRDISGKYVADSYTSRVRNRMRAGFLRLAANGEPEIVPCDIARFSHRDLDVWWSENKPVFKKGERENGKYRPTTVARKYALWEKLCKKNGITKPYEFNVQISDDNVSAIGTGSTVGFPVLTGQISDCTDDEQGKNGKWIRGKYHDFVFHSSRGPDSFRLHEVDPAAWRDFLFIHGDEDGKPDMPWPGFWKAKFWKKEKVPVFYIQNGNRLQIGLAYMPKLAGDFSIHDMIGHTSEDHLDETKDDLATLLFGRVSDRADDALKGRVHFDLASINGQATPIAQPVTILSSPKPTYFPNYIRQNANGPGWKLNGGDKAQYATYLETQTHPKPELRGWKRYPARPEDAVKVQEPYGEDQERNKKVQLCLHTLPAQTSFTGRLVFHNLKPEELGALLWCLDFGGEAACRHGLGSGKPFGFGQVSLAIDDSKSRIEPNDPGTEAASFKRWAESCVKRFEDFMDRKLGQTWKDTPQLRALMVMANPNGSGEFPGKLKHMILARVPDPTPQNPNKKKTINQFQKAKQAALVLASYVPLPAAGRSRSFTAEKALWSAVKLTFSKGQLEIRAASSKGDNAFVRGADAKALLDALDDDKRKRLEKGKLTADLTVEHCGGKNWKIVAIAPVDHQ